MEEKQLTSRELEEQANALLAEADFEEIKLPKKAKKAAAAKKANEDTAQAEKPAEKYPPLDEKLVASLPAAALLQGNEKLMEIFAKGKAKGKLSSSDLMETIDEMNLESEQLDQIYDSLETLGIDIGTAEAIDSSIDDVEPPMEEIAEIEEEELVDPNELVDSFSTDDPVRMYLKEIGKVSLLSADEEISLATAMSAGVEAKQKLEEAEKIKATVKANADRLAELEKLEEEYEQKIHKIMLLIPNIIDPSVPIGPDDSCNVEVERFGEPKVPDFEIPYHTQIMESFDGVDMDAAGRVSGAGFYYLLGDIARLHEGVLAYARDFMIDKGFTFCIPPFMIHGNVVEGVMSQNDMDAMMYKIEGEDLYLIGTSEHSMVGRFIGEILPESSLPQTLTSYSPCFRKEKGAHGIEERGIYRIHQFEKQEMIVVCKPEDSMDWYNKMWKWSVELFRSMDIPVRQLECCSGDLADLKVKSCDIEAWSPRQKKYFEVCSCSNLGDAQARRLKIRVKGEDGKMYLPHTLNNTVVAPPRMLIAFLENNLQADGSVLIPKVLQPYMGGKAVLIPKK